MKNCEQQYKNPTAVQKYSQSQYNLIIYEPQYRNNINRSTICAVPNPIRSTKIISTTVQFRNRSTENKLSICTAVYFYTAVYFCTAVVNVHDFITTGTDFFVLRL